MEAFVIDLKGAIMLLSNICHHGLTMERDGAIPSKVDNVNCTITKIISKRGMCMLYYCAYLVQLLLAMFCHMYHDNTCKTSQMFCSLEYMIVVSVGFDKSNTGFAGTWHPCNWKKGNLALLVQSFVCLKGPVSENYENELKTI